MSELKAITAYEANWKAESYGDNGVLVYLKSEADKVIAELKSDYKEACDRLHTANLIKDEQLAATRHQKYKRCLAMAKWCASRSASWCLDPADDELHKSDFYDKWKLRWLELAEKFKEAK